MGNYCKSILGLALIMLALFASLNVKAQEKISTDVIVTYQPKSTQYAEVAVLVGLTDKGERQEISAGPLYRRYLSLGIGMKNYYGATLYAQGKVYKDFFLYLKTDFVYGDWIQKDKYVEIYTIKTKFEPMPTFGVGYQSKKGTSIQIGLNPFVYNPKAYYKDGTNPYQAYGMAFSIKQKLFRL